MGYYFNALFKEIESESGRELRQERVKKTWDLAQEDFDYRLPSLPLFKSDPKNRNQFVVDAVDSLNLIRKYLRAV